MASVEHLLRFGYALVVVTIMLMMWSSYVRADNRQSEPTKHASCPFNPLCTCSKPGPDLGIVQCRNVPFPSIPSSVNSSKVFTLHIENTGLRELEPYFFQATGLYRLEISHNLLTEIPDDSFSGLERSLWELLLQNNELIEVPSRAIRHLKKLKHLDLSGNQISCIEPDSFRGLSDSLQTLILSKNLLNTLPPDSFSTLPQLDTIDLSGNNIAQIDATIFRDGMPRLSKLILADNILTEIPYMQVAPLKQLRTLDLSHNLIKFVVEPAYVPDPSSRGGGASGGFGRSGVGGDFGSNGGSSEEIYNGGGSSSVEVYQGTTTTTQRPTSRPIVGVKLTLDVLHLEYNLIEMLATESFRYFDIVNVTFLDGNPLREMRDEAFRSCRMRELYIRFCDLTKVSPLAFEGLGATLQILDLTGNNVTTLPEHLFKNFDVFRILSLKGNKLVPLVHNELFAGFQSTLEKLDLSGETNAVTDLQALRRLRRMRSLSVSRLKSTHLVAEDFVEFGLDLEDLKINGGNLQSVKSHAFQHVRGIKRLDLSENKISQFEADAFTEIGHSLLSLRISHGLAGSMTALPSDAMRHLTSLQELDVSNNQLKTMSDTSFHFLKDLRVLEMHDNRLEQVLKGTFQNDIHGMLEVISLGFNYIKHIAQHTFVDLEALKRLHLDDNRIEHIERRAFMNLRQLRHLSLRGNKLTAISDEGFQVFEDDTFPQFICAVCEQDVDRFYDKITAFKTVEAQWMAKLKNDNPTHPYLQVLEMVQECTTKVHNLIKSLKPDDRSAGRFSPYNLFVSPAMDNGSPISILQHMLLDRHIYKVKSLQQLCLDYFNANGPNMLDTVLKVAEPLETTCVDDSEATQHFDDDSQSQDVFVDKSDDGARHKKKRRPNPVRHYINSRRRRNLKKHQRSRPTRPLPKLAKAMKTLKEKLVKPKPIEVTAVKATVVRDDSPDSISTDTVVRTTRYSERRSRSLSKLQSLSPHSVASPLSLPAATPPPTTPSAEVMAKRSRTSVIAKTPIVPPPPADLIGSTERRSRSSLRKLTAPITTPPVSVKKPPCKSEPAADKKSTTKKTSGNTVDSKSVSSDPKPIVSDVKPTDVKPASFPFKMPEKRKFRTHKDYIRNITKKKRTSKMRINYSEALVDEALMYEEILMDKEAKEQLVMSTAIETSKKAAAASSSTSSKKSLNAVEQWKADAVASSDICISKVTKATTCKPQQQKLTPSTALPSPSSSISSEISITPIRKPGPARASQSSKSINLSLSEIQKTFKSNPDVVFNISSAVSIQLKSVSSSPAAKSDASNDMCSVDACLTDGPVQCKYCDRLCGNMNHLAVHQTQHMQLQTHKVGEAQVLAPKWRRGRMVPMGNQKCFRCLNCWRLHPDSQSILEHWVSGKCLFYCSICGASFHHNPKLIRSHFPQAHGIRYKLPEDTDSQALVKMIVPSGGGGGVAAAGSGAVVQVKKIFRPIGAGGRSLNPIVKGKPTVAKSGRVTCHVCSCSFPNMHSRNSHMRLHKTQKLTTIVAGKPIQVTGPAATTSAPVRLTPTQIRNGMRYNRLSINNPDAKHPAFQFRPPPGPKSHSHQIAQGQLQQLLQQQPKPFNFNSSSIRNRQQVLQHQQQLQQQRQRRQAAASDRRLAEVNHFAANIKAEIDIDEQDYSEYNSVGDYTSDGLTSDYTNVMPIQPEVVMSNDLAAKLPEITIKAEPIAGSSSGGGGNCKQAPRIQIKKLIELQEPTYTSTSVAVAPPTVTSSAYYVTSQATNPPVVITTQQQLQLQPQQLQMSAATQLPAYHLAPTQSGQILQVASQQIQVQQQQQQPPPQQLPQFQISQVQQLQNTQYYNPVFVVQQPQQSQEMYQYNDQFNEYNKYYS